MRSADHRAVIADSVNGAIAIVRLNEVDASSQVVLGTGHIDVCRAIADEARGSNFSLPVYMAWQASNGGSKVYLGFDFLRGEKVSVAILAKSQAEAMHALFPASELDTVKPRTRFSQDFRLTVDPDVIKAASEHSGEALYASHVGARDFLPRQQRLEHMCSSRPSPYGPRLCPAPATQRAADRFQTLSLARD
jgi:phage FluMu gp28-like protein